MAARLASLLVGLLLLALLATAGTASAARSIPIGMYNVNNQVMNSADYVYALRFVVDENTTLHRFISGFNLEGSDQLGGRQGYADGTAGRIRARLVAVKPNGDPDLSQIIAEETVGAWQRYQESKSAFGAPGLTQLLYFNMGGVQLQAGRMYAMTYQNVDPSPSANWFSENSPTVKESVAGPNGTNTLDPNAPGAIAGLDPREAVAWSKDGGGSWVWGRHAGEGDTKGSYGGSATGDDGTRLPWYGWQEAPGAAAESNQPYYAYKESGSYTLRVKSVPKAATLTEAGGYAPAGASAGVITVRNLATGETGRTAPLGSGLVKGTLDHPVAVAPGQSYEISNSGTVLKAEGDSFIQSTFKVGTGRWSVETAGHGSDMAQLFVAPHPWFAPGAASVPAAPAPAAPTEVIVQRAAVAVHGKPHAAPARVARKRTARRRAKLRLVGRVRGGLARPGLPVAVQVRRKGGWRTVGHARLKGNGRFALRRGTKLQRGTKRLRLRAIVRGGAHSKTVRVKVRR